MPRLFKMLATVKCALAALVLTVGVADARGTVGDERGQVQISINKSTQTMTVTVDGKKVHTWKVSTGKVGHTTPGGTFRVLSMHAMHHSAKYNNAPMPNSMFFTNAGHAIHGTTAVGMLGRVASHGCVRLAPGNAKILFDLVKRHGASNTSIHIS
jgi:lipoprotein-anchoring transpeptidase ErfK/SrfK